MLILRHFFLKDSTFIHNWYNKLSVVILKDSNIFLNKNEICSRDHHRDILLESVVQKRSICPGCYMCPAVFSMEIMSLNKKLTFFFIGWSKLRILMCPYLINYMTHLISLIGPYRA